MADSQSQSQFAEACRLLVAGKYEDAAHSFHEILQGAGDHPSVRYNFGLSLECCKKFQDAAKQYSTVIREFPEYPPAYIGMANCFFYEGDLEHCEGMLYAAREADPTDPRAAILLAEVLILRGSEKEGIAQHIEALNLIDGIQCFKTHNHALCYADLGVGGEGYYCFWETSLLQRGFPELPDVIARSEGIMLLEVLMAHGGNAADIARRLTTVPREHIYLVTLDDMTHTILSEYAPDMHLSGITYELHELPALMLHIGNHLVQQLDGVTVLLPADDGKDDGEKLAWAGTQAACEKDTVSVTGDLVSSRPIDARRLPPVLGKGQHAAPDTFAKLFSTA